MNKKQLEITLSGLEGFEDPQEDLEQYKTPGSIAADMLHSAYMQGDIEGKIVADLGCGTGVLSIGASLLGAKKVYGVDIEANAIGIAMQNHEKAGKELDIEWVLSSVDDFSEEVDVVVQNPPFGIKNPHADRIFLETGLKIASVVYSIHDGNEDTRKFIKNHIKSLEASLSWVKRLEFELPKTLEHHKHELVRIPIDIYRVIKDENK